MSVLDADLWSYKWEKKVFENCYVARKHTLLLPYETQLTQVYIWGKTK